MVCDVSRREEVTYRANGTRDIDLRVAHILERYSEGYYPYYDRKIDKFYWDREGHRTIVELTQSASTIALRELRKQRVKFEVHGNRDFHGLLSLLADESIRAETWVKGKVIEVYRVLHGSGRVHSIEAYHGGKLAGGVLVVAMPGMYAAETMVSAVRGASSAALYTLVASAAQLGVGMLDVQVKHAAGAPSQKLKERTMPLTEYLVLLDTLCTAPLPRPPDRLGVHTVPRAMP